MNQIETGKPSFSPTPTRCLQAAGFIACIGWLALGLQLWLTITLVLSQGRGLAMGLVIYFGFFTVLTNLLATVVLSALWLSGPLGRTAGTAWAHYPVTQATTAAAISLVGLVYFLILRHTWHPVGAQWAADVMLH